MNHQYNSSRYLHSSTSLSSRYPTQRVGSVSFLFFLFFLFLPLLFSTSYHKRDRRASNCENGRSRYPFFLGFERLYAGFLATSLRHILFFALANTYASRCSIFVESKRAKVKSSGIFSISLLSSHFTTLFIKFILYSALRTLLTFFFFLASVFLFHFSFPQPFRFSILFTRSITIFPSSFLPISPFPWTYQSECISS